MRKYVNYKKGETQEKFEQRVKNANLRYGEVGELISYCIAIHFLKAAQLVSKWLSKHHLKCLFLDWMEYMQP
ncbi:Hachiman antiphage defense system protein HamA [Escherichia coli]|nr:Hachiman antiphage defense system protein HamA [Escherichia coli]MDX1860434.1 Hachiman antiphage defense system protein HamA [Escherichia coli]